MSFEPDSVEHEATNEDISHAILVELRVISRYLSILVDEDVDWTREDEEGEVDL